MADIAGTVAAQLARFGQACTISWPARGVGSLSLPAAQASSTIRVRTRTFTDASGVLQTLIEGMMPPTDRNLQGATIQVGTRPYTVISNVETVYLGSVIFQKVGLR